MVYSQEIVNEKPSLRIDQIADLSYLIQKGKALLLHDPGTGKTPTVCMWLYYHWSTHKHKSVWVMPVSLMVKNRMELLRFTHFEEKDIQIVKTAADLSVDAVVYLMSATRFRMCADDLSSDIKVLAADEPHLYWTRTTSQVTQAFYRFMRKRKYFVGMTGTLIKGRLDSCYPMLHVIEPRYYGSYQGFLNTHAVYDDWGNVSSWTNAQELTKRLANHALMRTFESVHGKEAKIIQTVQCEMSPKQYEAYKEFESKAILELGDRFLEGETGGVYTLRCRQIMATPEVFGLGTAGKDEMLKLALADHVRNDKPLIIFGAFKAELERIARLVKTEGLTVGLLYGDTSAKHRADIDRKFQTGEIQVLVGSPLVAAVGFNWQSTARGEVDHMIFTSLDYGDDSFIQGYRRAVRGQRTSPLLIEIYEYENSIDQKIFGIIKRKSELNKETLTDREVFDFFKTRGNNDSTVSESPGS